MSKPEYQGQKTTIKKFDIEGTSAVHKYQEIVEVRGSNNGYLYSDAYIFESGLRAVKEEIYRAATAGIFSEWETNPRDFLKLKISEQADLMNYKNYDIKVLGIQGSQMAIEVIDMPWDEKFKGELMYGEDPDEWFQCVISVPKGKYMPREYSAGMIIENVGIRTVKSAGRYINSLCKYKKEVAAPTTEDAA